MSVRVRMRERDRQRQIGIRDAVGWNEGGREQGIDRQTEGRTLTRAVPWQWPAADECRRGYLQPTPRVTAPAMGSHHSECTTHTPRAVLHTAAIW